MQVTIINYEPNERNLRQGFVDIKVSYIEKSETFRGLGYFVKGDKRWISLQNVKRGETWLPSYERTPPLNKEIFIQALKALDQHLVNLQPSALENNEPEPVTDMF